MAPKLASEKNIYTSRRRARSDNKLELKECRWTWSSEKHLNVFVSCIEKVTSDLCGEMTRRCFHPSTLTNPVQRKHHLFQTWLSLMQYFKTSTKHVDGITANDTKVEHQLQNDCWLNHLLLLNLDVKARVRVWAADWSFCIKVVFEATGEKCSSSRAIMTRGITLREPSGGGSNRINEEAAVRK